MWSSFVSVWFIRPMIFVEWLISLQSALILKFELYKIIWRWCYGAKRSLWLDYFHICGQNCRKLIYHRDLPPHKDGTEAGPPSVVASVAKFPRSVGNKQEDTNSAGVAIADGLVRHVDLHVPHACRFPSSVLCTTFANERPWPEHRSRWLRSTWRQDGGRSHFSLKDRNVATRPCVANLVT